MIIIPVTFVTFVKFVTFVIFFSIIVIYFNNKYNLVEGYESLTHCLEQGYNHDFCLQVPPQAVLNNDFKMWKPKFKTV